MEIVKTASLFSVGELHHAQMRDLGFASSSQEQSLPLEGTPAHLKGLTTCTTAVTSPVGATTGQADAGEAILLMNVWDSSEHNGRSLPPANALPFCESAHTRADKLNAYANYVLEAMH